MRKNQFFLIILLSLFPTIVSCKQEGSKYGVSLGAKLYKMHCIACHLEDGSGIDGVNPSLKNIDKKYSRNEMLEILKQGSLYFENNTRKSALVGYMPQFPHLTSEENDAIISYITNELR